MYKEQWMYSCEVCGVISIVNVDHGDIFCTGCFICNDLQFHHKVIIAKNNNLYGEVKMFIQNEEEKEDVGSKGIEEKGLHDQQV